MLKKISIYLIGLIPLALVAGPFVAELILFSIFSIFIYYLVKEKPFYLFKLNIFKLFLIFWLYLIFTSLFADEFIISLKSSFFYIRFGLYTLAIIYFLITFDEHLNIIYRIYQFTLIFVILDSFFQIFTGADIFGLEPQDKELRRISGPFGEKQILGSFLQKILPIYIYFIFKLFESSKKLKILDLTIITFSLVLIFRSGDRAALGLILLFSLILFLYSKQFRKKILLIGMFFIVISSILFFQNPNFQKRIFVDTLGQFKGKHYEHFLKKDENETNLNFMIFSFVHQTHYSTSFRMFKNKPLFGHGVKMFRYSCKNFQFKSKRQYIDDYGNLTSKYYGCSTHPHNTYMQLLAETGIFGFIALLVLFFYLLVKILTINKGEQNLLSVHILLIAIFINLWPLIPTGNFFNNWISMIYFVPISYYLFEINYKRKK